MGTYAIYVTENYVHRYFVKANSEAEAERLYDEDECTFDPYYYDFDSMGSILKIEKVK